MVLLFKFLLLWVFPLIIFRLIFHYNLWLLFCDWVFRIMLADLFPFAETEWKLFFQGVPKGLKAFFSQVLRGFLTELGSFNMKFGSFSSAGIISIVKIVLALINEKCVGVIIVLRYYNSLLPQIKLLAFTTTSILSEVERVSNTAW